LNKYVDEKEPWKLVKEESKQEELKNFFYTIAESLRQV
jgi:methionyl-tRNA synthetase